MNSGFYCFYWWCHSEAIKTGFNCSHLCLNFAFFRTHVDQLNPDLVECLWWQWLRWLGLCGWDGTGGCSTAGLKKRQKEEGMAAAGTCADAWSWKLAKGWSGARGLGTHPCQRARWMAAQRTSANAILVLTVPKEWLLQCQEGKVSVSEAGHAQAIWTSRGCSGSMPRSMPPQRHLVRPWWKWKRMAWLQINVHPHTFCRTTGQAKVFKKKGTIATASAACWPFAFCQQPPDHVVVDRQSMVCISEEVRIGFQFDMSEKVLGKLQLPSWVMDFTLKTNSWQELLLDLIGFPLEAQELQSKKIKSVCNFLSILISRSTHTTWKWDFLKGN